MVGLVGLVLDQHHSTKGTSAQSLDAVEVIKTSCILEEDKLYEWDRARVEEEWARVKMHMVRGLGKDYKI